MDFKFPQKVDQISRIDVRVSDLAMYNLYLEADEYQYNQITALGIVYLRNKSIPVLVGYDNRGGKQNFPFDEGSYLGVYSEDQLEEMGIVVDVADLEETGGEDEPAPKDT